MTEIRYSETISRVNANLPVNSDGQIAPPNSTYKEFLEWADEDTLAEWVDGTIEMTSPASLKHQEILTFLTTLIGGFVEFSDIGVIIPPPFQMKLPKSGREPDLIFVAKNHLERLKKTFLDGPADLAVEILSPESSKRDRETKLKEYAEGKVLEYWLIDPIENKATFYHLEATNKYEVVKPDSEGKYYSRELKNFWLRPDWFWQQQLPNVQKTLLEIGGNTYAQYLIGQLKQQGLL